MTSAFLYTVPQWIVFAALFMIIYGWVEHKKTFRLIGLGIYVLLGAMAVMVLSGDYLAPGNFLSANEIAAEELNNEVLNETPIEAQLLPAYLSFILAALLALPTIFMDWKAHRRAKLFIVLTSVAALAGFFIVVGAVQSM
jgi:predicted membrane channel-forming protein YqfA (hemolysin III family)